MNKKCECKEKHIREYVTRNKRYWLLRCKECHQIHSDVMWSKPEAKHE